MKNQDTILWRPSKAKIADSQMFDFMQKLNNKYSIGGTDYEEVWQWSVENPALFWKEVWEYTGIIASRQADAILDDPGKMPGAHWFEGARLNFAENLLRRKDGHTALIFRGEDSVRKEYTYAALYEEVRKAAIALRKAGVRKGDRVAAFMPNMPETVIFMLATASTGAIWSSTSPDFGIKGVLDRFSQIEPKIILAADGYFYKGKSFDSQAKLRDILDQLPGVQQVVVVDYTGNRNTQTIPKAIAWEDFVTEADGDLEFEQLPFDHPLYIMYSSGTTGLPKSIVHSAGGTLIQHLKELRLHSDMRPEDTVFYFTTCGWMMWNWIVSSLALGVSLVLYDGNPFYPGPEALLKMADELNISFFGTSAKYIASLESAGVKPKEISSFPYLRTIASTGSPLTDESFEYVYREWKEDVQLSSISGGTDIISCFVLGNPVLPVYKGEIQCRGLGMDVDCFDDYGQSVRNEQGELVCKTAFPSMPVYFWNDTDQKRYREAYFSTYPNIWRHGDYISINDHGGIIIYGRSDATLNPQGVRIGTAEIYRVLENMKEIDDSVVVGKKEAGDEKVVLFVKLPAGQELTDALTQLIRNKIRTQCSPRHVPAIILQAPDIPYTLNGKKVEVAVKKLIHGQKVLNKDALANPGSLAFFENVKL